MSLSFAARQHFKGLIFNPRGACGNSGFTSIEVGRWHECRRCTQECVRHAWLYGAFVTQADANIHGLAVAENG